MNRIGLVAVSMFFSLASAACFAEGLSVTRGDAVWPSWQGRHVRLTTTQPTVAWWAGVDERRQHSVPMNALLLGDYYFSMPGWQMRQGSLRASSGLMVTLRPAGTGLRVNAAHGLAPTASALPYVGLGYAGLSAKGAWTLSADIGLVAENPSGSAQIGRALFGHQSLDAALRDMRLTPLLKMAVNYAF